MCRRMCSQKSGSSQSFLRRGRLWMAHGEQALDGVLATKVDRVDQKPTSFSSADGISLPL